MKVGNRKVLLSTTFMVPDGEEASFSYELAQDDVFHCRLLFTHEAKENSEKKATIKTEFENDLCTLTFDNFNSAAGHSTNKPIVACLSNAGEPISFLATVYKLKTFTKLEIQIMLEPKQQEAKQ